MLCKLCFINYYVYHIWSTNFCALDPICENREDYQTVNITCHTVDTLPISKTLERVLFQVVQSINSYVYSKTSIMELPKCTNHISEGLKSQNRKHACGPPHSQTIIYITNLSPPDSNCFHMPLLYSHLHWRLQSVVVSCLSIQQQHKWEAMPLCSKSSICYLNLTVYTINHCKHTTLILWSCEFINITPIFYWILLSI